jgi:DNA polymerase-3 subunit beta
VSFRGVYPAQVEETGALCLPAHYFHNLVKKVSGDFLDLVTGEDSKLQIQVGKYHYQVLGLPADQFPPIPEVGDQAVSEVESKLLREMIGKVIFSVCTDDSRRNLCGVLWEKVGDSQLRLVSTDGHRLTLIQRELPVAIEDKVLVPRKGMAEIFRLLSGVDKVRLGLNGENLVLKTDRESLFVRLLDEKFADYRRVIPKSFAFRFRVNRLALHDAIERISLLSKERVRGVVFNLNSEQLEVNFQNPEVGEGREVLAVALEKGDDSRLPLQVSFNARYLLEPLSTMKSEEVLLELNDQDSPVRLTDGDDYNYFGVIMPMVL